MSESHLQIDEYGKTVESKTLLWSTKASEQEEIIRSIFTQECWNISNVEKVQGCHWKIQTSCPLRELKINLYISSVRDEDRANDEFKTQLGSITPNFDENGWICLILGIYTFSKEDHSNDYILAYSNGQGYNFKSNPSLRLARTRFLQHARNFGICKTENSILFKPQYIYSILDTIDNESHSILDNREPSINITSVLDSNHYLYFNAIRTKPFLLLAGVSGTGKSRIVRKLAQGTVTEDLQRKYDKEYKGTDFKNDRWNLHKPANFELIQVKPNWHNSMDVVGYKSNIGGTHYEFTPFVEFVARAWQHQEIPFFLCLDEMNLAPVEQYFTEFLSAIESRSLENGNYRSEPIIKAFSSFKATKSDKGEVVDIEKQMIDDLLPAITASESDSVEAQRIKYVTEIFKNNGVSLPQNLIVIGTVNMDETTFSFSRKVLDRAMSIEMNEVDYSSFLTGQTDDKIKTLVELLENENGDNILNNLLVKRQIEAKEVIGELGGNKEDGLAKRVLNYLDAINSLLEGTPFKLGYRAANEAIIYLQSAIDFGNNDFVSAMDNFTLMKILSRIEGDETKLSITDTANDTERLNKANVDKQKAQEHGNLTILTTLREIISQHLGETYLVETEREEDNAEESTEETIEQSEPKTNTKSAEKLNSIKKIDSMISQLERDHFVTYWN